MATVTRKVVKMDEAPVGFTFTAGVTAGTPLDFQGRDDKTLILLNNTGSGAGTIKVKMGNGIQAVGDVTYDVPAGFSAIAVSSGAYKKTKGDNKGNVVVEPSATTIAFAVIEID